MNYKRNFGILLVLVCALSLVGAAAPSYDTVKSFIANDITEEAVLISGEDQTAYAHTLVNNSTAAGIDENDTEIWLVSFADGCTKDRAVVVFNTSDKGQVIIDDTPIIGGGAIDKNVTQLVEGQRFISGAFETENCTKDYSRGIVKTITKL